MKALHSGSGRRSRRECLALARGFEDSGMTRREYGRHVGLAPSSLDYYRRAARGAEPRARLVAVEVAALPELAEGTRALAVVLAGGRRVEVGPGFDAETLTRLLQALEARP